MAHLFVDDLERPEMTGEDRHHLERVRRLRPGEVVTVSDGRGGLRPCVYRSGGALEPTAEASVSPPPAPTLTIGFALVKGERPEWIVQKLTECGIDRIVPFAARRSVVRWDPERSSRNVVRLRRVAREAAMQCRRTWLPVLEPLAEFSALADSAGSAAAMADLEGHAPDLRWPVVLVGPEGGWSPEERAKGLVTVRLGPTVLRTETAALAAGVVMSALRSGIVRAVS